MSDRPRLCGAKYEHHRIPYRNPWSRVRSSSMGGRWQHSQLRLNSKIWMQAPHVRAARISCAMACHRTSQDQAAILDLVGLRTLRA
jgi:hypothetical protein